MDCAILHAIKATLFICKLFAICCRMSLAEVLLKLANNFASFLIKVSLLVSILHYYLYKITKEWFWHFHLQKKKFKEQSCLTPFTCNMFCGHQKFIILTWKWGYDAFDLSMTPWMFYEVDTFSLISLLLIPYTDSDSSITMEKLEHVWSIFHFLLHSQQPLRLKDDLKQ